MTVGDSSDSSDPEVKASRNKGIMTLGHDDSSGSSDPKVITSHNKGIMTLARRAPIRTCNWQTVQSALSSIMVGRLQD